MSRSCRALVAVAVVVRLLWPGAVFAQTPGAVSADAERRVEGVIKQVIAWRRDFHEHPELGFQETRTAKVIADHLRSLGMDVQTGLATTGVVGV
jgi:amidohydrolase